MKTLPKNYKKDFIISKDKTMIGYRQLGYGPGLILVYGDHFSVMRKVEDI